MAENGKTYIYYIQVVMLVKYKGVLKIHLLPPDRFFKYKVNLGPVSRNATL